MDCGGIFFTEMLNDVVWKGPCILVSQVSIDTWVAVGDTHSVACELVFTSDILAQVIDPAALYTAPSTSDLGPPISVLSPLPLQLCRGSNREPGQPIDPLQSFHTNQALLMPAGHGSRPRTKMVIAVRQAGSDSKRAFIAFFFHIRKGLDDIIILGVEDLVPGWVGLGWVHLRPQPGSQQIAKFLMFTGGRRSRPYNCRL